MEEMAYEPAVSVPYKSSRTKVAPDGCQFFHVSVSTLKHFGASYSRDAIDIVDMFIMNQGVRGGGGLNLNARNAG